MTLYGNLTLESPTFHADKREVERFWLVSELWCIFLADFGLLWLLVKLITRKFMSHSLRILCLNQCIADLLLLVIRYFLLLHLLHDHIFIGFYHILSLIFNGFHDFFIINTICILFDCLLSTIFAEDYRKCFTLQSSLFISPWLSSIIFTTIIIAYPSTSLSFNPVLSTFNLGLFTVAHVLQYYNHRKYRSLTNISLAHQCILRNNVKNMKIISLLCISDSIITITYFAFYYMLQKESERSIKYITFSGIFHTLRVLWCLILPLSVKYFYFSSKAHHHPSKRLSQIFFKKHQNTSNVYFIFYNPECFTSKVVA